jgi:hypothetical protein
MQNLKGLVQITNSADSTTIWLDGEHSRIGIGKDSPEAALHIVTEGASGSHFTVSGHTVTLRGVNLPGEYRPRLPYIEWVQADGERAMYLGWGNTSGADAVQPKRVDLSLEHGYHLCIRQDGGGYVGIANLNPQEMLDVAGNIRVSGDLIAGGNIRAAGDVLLEGADCAEEFDVVDTDGLDAGAVLVIGDEGKLHTCTQAYDQRVAGVISGAGEHRPGIILGRAPSRSKRVPIALSGKVYCRVDAQYGAIEVGDLLTTSATHGHAMKALDPQRAFGAVLGKALRPLHQGQSLIPILVALQ